MPWYVLTSDSHLGDWYEVDEFDDEDDAREYVWYLQTKERIAGVEEDDISLFRVVRG